MREYHAAMGRRIMEYEGTLEHFAGDGMHIFFNDPVLQPDHQLRAVRMAVAMREDVAELAAAGWAKRGYDARVRGRDRGRASRPPGGSGTRAATTTRRSATP